MMFKILIHGGAGVISKELDSSPYYAALNGILKQLYLYSQHPNISAVDIVEYGVILLEDNPLFNAGCGSVYTCDNTHELDASIMDGKSLRCGSVSVVKNVKNPICLARAVMDKTQHNFIVGAEATSLLADSVGLTKVEQSYYSTDNRRNQLVNAKKNNSIELDHNQSDGTDQKGTVGCVCMYNGHVAAATSTGGMTNKLCGRVGDTPIIGAGTYATDVAGAISATGHGEEFIRHVAAYNAISRVTIGNSSLSDAMKYTVHSVLPKGTGGMIGVDSTGEGTFEFNCSGMFRGSCDSDGKAYVGIWEELRPLSISD